MSLVWGLLSWVVWLYLMLLLIRAIVGWVQIFSRDWRPRGVILVIVEIAFTATDPPIKAVSRFVPPVRLGSVMLDVSFTLVSLACIVLLQVLGMLA